MSVGEVCDLAGGVLLLLGALLGLVAAIGVVRLPDVLTRMHAATKPQVLGLMLVVAGMSLVLRDVSVVALGVLVVLAQMVTAPVAAHMVGRASYRAGQIDDELLVVDELTGEVEPAAQDGTPEVDPPR
ncbi:monovalent cation/H(+) antiporter subunit G [Nocardioides litoris]|uniref:monovalent cation/H(+) antiporter subunit G n=1 Tax=Nocardioides litoris TaxID=1926648 RepID=UPI00111EB298|nr:monovalent cation/H(+) antiporter subunit G [Nocardioides litoris]